MAKLDLGHSVKCSFVLSEFKQRRMDWSFVREDLQMQLRIGIQALEPMNENCGDVGGVRRQLETNPTTIALGPCFLVVREKGQNTDIRFLIHKTLFPSQEFDSW